MQNFQQSSQTAAAGVSPPNGVFADTSQGFEKPLFGLEGSLGKDVSQIVGDVMGGGLINLKECSTSAGVSLSSIQPPNTINAGGVAAQILNQKTGWAPQTGGR